MLTGEFRNTLDEKGRISLPARLRGALGESGLVLTQGMDSCLWLFSRDQWEILAARLTGSASPFQANARMVQRRIIAPAQEVEVDRLGRIQIPQSLREWASLVRECTILGMAKYIEIWDCSAYRSYLEATDAAFVAAAEDFKELTL